MLKQAAILVFVLLLAGCDLLNKPSVTITNEAIVAGQVGIIYNSGHPVVEKACFDLDEVIEADQGVTKSTLINNSEHRCKDQLTVLVPLEHVDSWNSYSNAYVRLHLQNIESDVWKLSKINN